MAKDHAAILQPGDHGSTFGGNALTCAAANASVRYIIEHDVSSHARQMGDYLKEGLERLKANHEFISEVRGLGLLLAVQFNSELTAAVVTACNEVGLLLNPLRPNALRLMPPLTVTADEIDEALLRLETGLMKAVS